MGLGVLAAVFHLADIRFPSLKWFFSWKEMAGWSMCALMILAGASMAWFAPGNYRFSPETERQIQRFRSIRRGYFSLVLLGLLVLFAMMDNLLVGNRALVVKYEGKVYFPVFRDAYSAATFGGEGDGEANYRELKKRFSGEDKGNWVLMPPVPWAPALDSDEEQHIVVEERKDGLYYMEGEAKALFRDRIDLLLGDQRGETDAHRVAFQERQDGRVDDSLEQGRGGGATRPVEERRTRHTRGEKRARRLPLSKGNK